MITLVDMDKYLAWLAGFADGEASFTLSVQKRRTSSGRWSLNIYPTISIHQHAGRRFVLDEIVERVGFGAVYLRRGGTMAHYQPTSRDDARRFVALLLPHLRVKKPQAELILRSLDLLDLRTKAGVDHFHGERVLDRDVAMQLVEIAATINMSPIGGKRMGGRTRKQMLGLVTKVYGQSAIEPKRLTVPCEQCQEPVERYHSDIDGKTRIFCSRACAGAWRSARDSKAVMVELDCAFCEVKFSRAKKAVKRGRHFCSPACANRFQADNRKAA